MMKKKMKNIDLDGSYVKLEKKKKKVNVGKYGNELNESVSVSVSPLTRTHAYTHAHGVLLSMCL